MAKNRNNSEIKNDSDFWDLSSLGIEFFFIIFAFVFGGNYLDEKFSIKPFGLFLGLIVGFVYGMYYIISRSAKLKEGKDKDKNV